MSLLTLLFLVLASVAMLTLGVLAGRLPRTSPGVLAAVCGLGTLLCLPPLLMGPDATGLNLPLGPPGLSLHFALDSLSLAFVVMIFLAGTAIAALLATAPGVPQTDTIRTTPLCIGGTTLALLAADGIVLTLGLVTVCVSIRPRAVAAPIMILVAVCLLTPPGYAPRFDAIRTAPADLVHAGAALALAVASVATMLWRRPDKSGPVTDMLTAGLLLPLGSYLLLRLTADLSATSIQPWYGFIPLLGGAAAAVAQGWTAAASPRIDNAANALVLRQAGLATASIGLLLIARADDLSAAASFALNATILTVIAGAIGGMLAVLAAHSIGANAGTFRLSRLGGLIQLMPGASVALSAALLTLSALPPGMGFVSLWLSFQSILSAPRTGGMLSQLPLALAAASLALTAALATAAAVRIAGIAVLGRPRSPRGAGAHETASRFRTVMVTLAAVSLLAGILPNPILWLLADPAAHALFGATSRPASAGYSVLAVVILVAVASAGAKLLPWQSRREAKRAGPWLDGFPPQRGLPFGEPSAQSAGLGFLPDLARPARPALIRIPAIPALPKISGLWLLLAAFVTFLLAVGISG